MRALNTVAAVPLRHRDVLVVQIGTETQIVPILAVDGTGVVEGVVIVIVIHVMPLCTPSTTPASVETLQGGLRHTPRHSATVQPPSTAAIECRGASSS